MLLEAGIIKLVIDDIIIGNRIAFYIYKKRSVIIIR